MTGSTKIKKTITKPQVPQSAIDSWLSGHPDVNPSGFTFSMLNDLKLTGSTKTQMSSAHINTTIPSAKTETYNIIKSLKTGDTFNFNSLTMSMSAQNTFSASTNIVKGKVNLVKSSGSTGPHRIKSTPVSLSGVTKSAPAPKKLLKTGLSLSEPSLVFTAGTVDYSFPNGDNYGFTDTIFDIKVQTDGKILVAGETYQTYYYDGDSWDMQGLIRLNSDGTVDETFDILFNEDCYGGGFNSTVYTIEIQPDGKILVGGSFTSFDRNGNCNTAGRLIRLNSDGSRDLTFNTGDGFNDDVYDIQLQPDGKILVGGYFDYFNNDYAYRIIRLNSNGSVDSSFPRGGDALFNDYVNKILLQPDGKILCGGYFTSYSGVSQNYITRLNSNGTLDTTFQIGNGFNDEVYEMALQSDGKIVVGGYFDTFDNNGLFGGHIIRLDSNGNIDTYFGYGLDGPVHSLAIQSNGKILVGGNISDYYPDAFTTLNVDELIRFNADCSFDYSFYYEELFNDIVEAIHILPDGKLLVGGSFNTNGDPAVYPLNYFGKLNNSITTYPYVYLGLISWCFNGDEQVITIGSMTPPVLSIDGPGNVYSFNVISNPSQTQIGIGILGNTGDLGYPTNIIDAVQVNDYGPSGMGGGCFSALSDNYLVAICSDVFNNYEPTALFVDKKYKLGDIGFFSYYNSNLFDEGPFYVHSTFQIIDIISINDLQGPIFFPPVSYTPYSSAEESVRANGQYIGIGDCYAPCGTFALSKQFDICQNGGNISFYNCTNCGFVEGSISIFGYFSAPYSEISGGTPTINSAKVWDSCFECAANNTPEGEINYDFNYDESGFNGDVYSIVEQTDGKILVGGAFDNYNGDNVNYLTRLSSNGYIDESFDVGLGFNGEVYTITVQTDGKILVGGAFTSYDDEFAGHIIRLNSDGSIDNSFTYGAEFNSDVYAIAVQNDGKIIVGGEFSYYYDYECYGYVRLNSNGTPDTTFKQYPFEGSVSSILLEDVVSTPGFYSNYSNSRYTQQNITIGGWFDMYIPELELGLGCLGKFKPDGTFINTYGQGFTNYYGGVYDMKKQSDGKLVCVGGFSSYQEDYCPWNIIRINTDGSQDTSFIGSISDDGGGFNDGWAYSLEILPNGKIMVGSDSQYFADRNDYYEGLGFLIRLNSDGSLDTTFTYVLDDGSVNKVLVRKDKTLLVGGNFNYYGARFISNMFIGEYFQLREFTTCDGNTANIYLPSTFENQYFGDSLAPISSISYSQITTGGLDLIVEGSYDDDYWTIDFPSGFSVDFLKTNYTSVNVSSNPYITFGDPTIGNGADDCCFDIPNGIPTATEQPGVYLSFQCPDSPGDIDAQLYELYTGLTDGGNTMVIKYVGSDHCDEIATLIYGFRFYKDEPSYFDIVIETNTNFFNGNPTGGVSNGVDPTWVSTFNSGSLKAYRIYNAPVKQIKANINTSNVVCGTVGDVITTPQRSGTGSGVGGSMSFDGINNDVVTVQYNIAMDLDFGSWTIEWFQKYTSTDTCCLRVFAIGTFPNEHISASIEDETIKVWIEYNNGGNVYTFPFATSILNTWSHFAITAQDINGTNRILRVFQDGVQIGTNYTISVDLNNFDGPTELPLIIGGMGDGTAAFQGYITNFRWNKGNCYYTSNFDVPTSPLIVDGSQLLLLASNEADVLYDSSESQYICGTTITWSSENPFGRFPEYFISTNTTTTYDSCDSCTLTDYYNVVLYVYGNTPYISNAQMTLSDIQNVQTFGPLFTTGGIEAYEILTYYK